MASLPEPGPIADAEGDPNFFLRRLAIATLSLLLVVIVVHLLREFQAVLKPLLVAVFLGYLVRPGHDRLHTRWGLPSSLAYLLLLLATLGLLFGLGILVYSNIEEVVIKLPFYQARLEQAVQGLLAHMPFDVSREGPILQELFGQESSRRGMQALRDALGPFLGFLGALAITFVYLVFLILEKVAFPYRLFLALGEAEGQRVLAVMGSINRAISEYLAVKTFVSFLAGALSVVVLAAFRVDFFLTWGILIFLFNYIPYLGSLVATILPVAMAFINLEIWAALVVAVLLLGIQALIGSFIEPRLAGDRLGVSPLLILLSLAFWGVVWGIVGMILAVPLLMVLKIVLENIRATRPIATLMGTR